MTNGGNPGTADAATNGGSTGANGGTTVDGGAGASGAGGAIDASGGADTAQEAMPVVEECPGQGPPICPATGDGGAAGSSGWKNYEVTSSFPKAPVAIVQKPGQLKFTKIVIQDQFLAESCAIGDYNGDGIPDVSSGRIWYEGSKDPTTTFKMQHPFRDGHGPLPRDGLAIEINTGMSDDWADYPWDMDGDGDTDIINIAQPSIPEANDPLGITGSADNPNAAGTPNKIGTVQVHATAYWYENPGKAGQAGDPNWTKHLMHADVRAEQHELVDINGDGYPEIVGACRACGMGNTKGYYQGDPKNPTAAWAYHGVTAGLGFPGGRVDSFHGVGMGDVNGDGLLDLLERRGAYLQQPGGTFNLTVCTGKNTPAGCGFIQEKTPLLPTGFYDGLPDQVGDRGASHMFAMDVDEDGCVDVVAADEAHAVGLAWYQQQKDAGGACNYAFKKFYFMGDAPVTAMYQGYPPASAAGDATKWGVGFTVPHALQVYDMDGDGRSDVIVGKMRFASPLDLNDPDPHGAPYLYVFKNVATPDSRNGAPITLQPVLVDGDPTAMEGTTAAGMGVGRQFAIGHVNTDGIMDICIASKVGLAVFLGQ
jgi:hypothetical protein